MLEAVSWFVSYFGIHYFDCYIFSKIINERHKKEILFYILIIIISMIDTYSRLNYLNVFQSISSNLLTFLVLKLVFKKSNSSTLLGTLFIFLAYAVSEVIFSVFFVLLLNMDVNFFVSNYIGIFIANYFMIITYLIIFKIKFIKKIIAKVIKWCDSKKIIELLFNILLIIVLTYIIISNAALIKEVRNFSVLYFMILLCIIVFVGGFFSEKSTTNKLTVEYTQLLEYVKDYEKEVVEKGKRQHEYKNQLIVINDMIPKSNKKLKKYVEDKLEIEENIKDNIWLEKLTNLPSGGIKGLIYYKLKKMIENNIDVYIDVDEELSDEKKWFNIDKNLEDYTRIIGVYLDNAIEASTESKDKQIIIEFVENKDNIDFILSNTYNGVINYQEIDKEKFSTKGKGRGYGLSLVKEIIEKNKLLSQTREVNGKFYVQKLTIKK